jgi:hypothetical protein
VLLSVSPLYEKLLTNGTADSSDGEILRLKDVATVQLRPSFLTPGGATGTTENFLRIGHSLFALIVGWLGGVLSRKFRPSH